jgi:hypothetical protein
MMRYSLRSSTWQFGIILGGSAVAQICPSKDLLTFDAGSPRSLEYESRTVKPSRGRRLLLFIIDFFRLLILISFFILLILTAPKAVSVFIKEFHAGQKYIA